MQATESNLEPIYLVYDGGGFASELVASVSDTSSAGPIFATRTPDGITHRLWAVTDPAVHRGVAADLAGRRALIADGHHRYATYRRLQSDYAGAAGPWDRGLTLLVDTSAYGPRVHPIHRAVAIPLARAVELAGSAASVRRMSDSDTALKALVTAESFTVVLTDGDYWYQVTDLDEQTRRRGLGADADAALGKLDITLLHRVLVEQVWGLSDDVETVDYAHDASEAIERARELGGIAVLVRATPVEAVASVAAAGARMPRKSTLFTPKPASGVVFRRFADATAESR
jgi:uncharacterized protein (DUF1015 family)